MQRLHPHGLRYKNCAAVRGLIQVTLRYMQVFMRYCGNNETYLHQQHCNSVVSLWSTFLRIKINNHDMIGMFTIQQ